MCLGIIIKIANSAYGMVFVFWLFLVLVPRSLGIIDDLAFGVASVLFIGFGALIRWLEGSGLAGLVGVSLVVLSVVLAFYWGLL